MSKDEMNAQINPSNSDTKIPVIIARVNRRDLKVKLLENKKNITTNVQCPDHLRKALIYDDVTPLRSRMMFHLRQRNDKTAFRFVWSNRWVAAPLGVVAPPPRTKCHSTFWMCYYVPLMEWTGNIL